jgi:hypothetical protein
MPTFLLTPFAYIFQVRQRLFISFIPHLSNTFTDFCQPLSLFCNINATRAPPSQICQTPRRYLPHPPDVHFVLRGCGDILTEASPAVTTAGFKYFAVAVDDSYYINDRLSFPLVALLN